MASLTVSGLGSSGIDVSSIVTQLMAIEKAPQNALSQKKTDELAKGTSWASINTQLTSLQTAVNALNSGNSLTTNKATVTDSSVLSASASAAATTGSVTFQVSSLAAAQQRASSGYASTTSTVGAGTMVVSTGLSKSGFTDAETNGIADGAHTLVVKTGAADGGNAVVTLDGTDYTVAVSSGQTTSFGGMTMTFGSGGLTTGSVVNMTTVTSTATTTLAELASAVNGANGPVDAAAVDTGSGASPIKLVMTAANTGTANALTVSGTGGLSGLASGMAVTTPAGDATITMGSLTITRSSNTINDLIPGVTLNLLSAAPGTNQTVSVGADSSGASDKVKALVDALNNTLNLLSSSSAYDTTNNTGQPLSGDPSVQMLQQQLSEMGSVFGSGTTSTMSQLGIQFTRDGRYTFDPTVFATQMASDPTGVAKLVNAAADSLTPVLNNALGTLTTTGWIQTAQQGITSTANDLQKQIDDWDVRLSDIQARYQTQYAALDAAISSMNSQKSWLTSTIAGLSANG